MKAPRTIMSAVFDSPWVRRPIRRRISLALAIVVAVFLGFWPRQYLAKVQLIPSDSTNGLASVLGSAGGAGILGSLLGSRDAIEFDLTVGRTHSVMSRVAAMLKEQGYAHNLSLAKLSVALTHGVEVEAVRGSVLEVTTHHVDAKYAAAVISDYVIALRDRLRVLSLLQNADKQRVAENRLTAAANDLAQNQALLDRFRQTNRLALPEVQLGSDVAMVANLQANLQAEETAVQTMSQFAAVDNIDLQARRARIAALQRQISAAEASNKGAASGIDLQKLTPQMTEYANLYRNERMSEAEYEIYRRYLDTIIVNNLSATITMDVIEPPYIDPQRQYNLFWFVLAVLIVGVGVIGEFYIASPPPGRPQ